MKRVLNLFRSARGNELFFNGITTLILASGSVLILIPLLYMISTSLKDPAQIRSDSTSLFPRKPKTVEVNGNLEPLYQVTVDGQVHEYALIKKMPGGLGQFVDPARPDVIHELRINDQKQLYRWDIHWENYPEAINAMPFWRYLGNTLIVTFEIGRAHV